ncbi:nicotinate (nicotinamide) nucleotide adenylyltransferase [Anaerorhabdus sp.]|uniref:nicotinate (nicotinamide) nucleotide adenylyltransferase n=1 Tax=Anaerorhabdus sp. TaxID=1872524 RepID=UPI002FC5BACE
MRKIGCLGGTFDPVHIGHIECAKKVLKTFGLDEIWLLPAKDAPLKNQTSTSFEMRTKMCKIACKPYRKLKVCTIENELPIPSYTINTVKELKKKYPHDKFYWIVGDDQVAQFNAWKDIDQLLSEVQFIAVNRNGLVIDDNRLLVMSDIKRLESSTRVRQGHFRDCCKGVRNYILNNELYLEEIVKNHCSEKRANHVFSMTKVCVELAKIHHVNMHEARMAGLLHDICKEMDKTEELKIMNIYFKDKLHLSNVIYHSYTAIPWIKENLGYTNKKVLSAIYNHTICNSNSKLSKILFISDKVDPSRGYDSSNLIEVSKRNLNEGYKLVLSERNEYLVKEGKQIDK